MATLNFPSDTSQSPYEENGYTYEWDGEKWNITSSPSGGGGGSDYVLPTATDVRLGGIKVGNNLTIDGGGVLSADDQSGGGSVGNLQQVTDAGNSTDNTITLGTTINGANAGVGITLYPEGGHYASVDDDDDPLWYGMLGGTGLPTSIIKGNGDANFAGNVVSGPSTLTATTEYGFISPGYIEIRGDNDLCLGIFDQSDATANIELNADGSASFASNITTSGDGYISAYRETTAAGNGLLDAHSDIGGTKTKKFVVRADGVVDIGGDVDSSPNIHLDGSDGSVSFVGGVTPGYIHIDDSPFYADDNQLFRIQEAGLITL